MERLQGQLPELDERGVAAGHLPEHCSVRYANPWIASDLSEPDLAIVDAARVPSVHPSKAHLLVEVSQTSRAKDLGPKARIYAAASAPLYWVVDLTQDVTHVLTKPTTSGYAAREERSFDRALHALGLEVVLAEVLRPGM